MPSAFSPPFMPISAATGPLTMTQIAAPPVLVATVLTLKAGSSTASIAVTTTGKYSGLQPAITALIATISALTVLRRAGTLPSTSSPSRPAAASIAATFCGVGGTTGRPSVHPFSNMNSTASASGTVSTALMRSHPSP